jgi:FixJ family two-component response regulator
MPRYAAFGFNNRMGEFRLVIAVVDDEEGVRKALRRLFLATNIDGRTFETGEAFLVSLATVRPDCVVLDLQMPGMTGLDILERLAASDAQLPAVVITAYDEPGSRERCLAAGASAYLRKPLDEHILLDTIEDAIERAHRSSALSVGWSRPLGEP